MKPQESQILDEQLDLLDRQARPEKWQRQHEDAMLCRDFEDLIALALETMGRIRRRSGSDPADVVWGYFRRWYAIGLQVEASVLWLEGRGYRLDRSDQFRFALNAAAMAN